MSGSSFLRALADGAVRMPLQQRPADFDDCALGWEGGPDANGIWYRWRIVAAIGQYNDGRVIYAREGWRRLPEDETHDPREAETFADGVVTWEAEIELHQAPTDLGGWVGFEAWRRCMREIMTAARSTFRYTEGSWPEESTNA